MAEISSFGEIEADGTVAHSNHSGDFSIQKNGDVFLLRFNQDMSNAVIVATAKTTTNADPGVVALVERAPDRNAFEVTIVQASNGVARGDRGFWFMALAAASTPSAKVP